MIADRACACQLRWEDVPLFGIMGSLAVPSYCSITIKNSAPFYISVHTSADDSVWVNSGESKTVRVQKGSLIEFQSDAAEGSDFRISAISNSISPYTTNSMNVCKPATGKYSYSQLLVRVFKDADDIASIEIY